MKIGKETYGKSIVIPSDNTPVMIYASYNGKSEVYVHQPSVSETATKDSSSYSSAERNADPRDEFADSMKNFANDMKGFFKESAETLHSSFESAVNSQSAESLFSSPNVSKEPSSINSSINTKIVLIISVAIIFFSFGVLLFLQVKPNNTEKVVETTAQVVKYRLNLEVSSEYNLIFSKYDISISVDGEELGTVTNGEKFEYKIEIQEGEHELSFCKSGSSSPKAVKKLVVSEDSLFSCELSHGSSSIEIKNEKYQSVKAEVITESTTQIETTKETEITSASSSSETSASETSSTTTMPSETTGKETTVSSNTETTAGTTSTSKTESVYYSTNSQDTVRDGNKGVYAYSSSGPNYEIYLIIDFDKGYVYRFIEGNGDTTCDMVKIVSGDLNDKVIITYHQKKEKWSYGIHFKWKRLTSLLILQEENGTEYEYLPTDLSKALALRKKKKIVKY